MCGDLARVVVKMLNARRCAWPWRERIVTGEDVRGILRRLAMDEDEVTGESDCARCANPIPGSGRGVSIYVW